MKLTFRATCIKDVVDALPGLLSWMLVGVQLTLQWESQCWWEWRRKQIISRFISEY